ncbi:MerR family transcriptional regulator [Nocardia higoensis]|uniref:MerR family transcriptional regulator n=1 Tax=Nocardia higoensis TaxID=228599 RepID=A0ABS0DH80_9NOCA|nr:MerR family transcriptional regulator [Nocardia higoensis]MBF6356053.1 MerR family transcriptional regulator [Nocardia higoensis]
MRIGELAEQAGVSVRSLRYYEEHGLLTSTRSGGGQRIYAPGDVDRVRLLQRLYAAGLSSRTIAEVLPCVYTPSAEQADETWDRLMEERRHLDDRIADLLRARDALDEIIAVNRRHRQTYRDASDRPRDDAPLPVFQSGRSRSVGEIREDIHQQSEQRSARP